MMHDHKNIKLHSKQVRSVAKSGFFKC